jgi:hypothetical protein
MVCYPIGLVFFCLKAALFVSDLFLRLRMTAMGENLWLRQ